MEFAISKETKIEKTLEYDVVIVGAGLAGLYTALHIDERKSCIILAKESVDISSSWLAQGGIAAAISRDDTPELHLKDTAVAGAGLCNMDAVAVLVNEGPSDISRLVSLDVPFDLDEHGELQITLEGGHNMKRVVHAGGDATGRVTVKALAHIVAQRKNITFLGQACLFDVLTGPGGVTGAVIRQNDAGFALILTNNVIIATGGIGQVYKSTTNPSVATGDGLAAAKRAGANLTNIEFIQFHPTGLWTPVSDGCEFLISEAVRGEGGLLVNSEGVRFMKDQHELAELAPRDIVARGIIKELKRSGESHAFIDITSKPEEYLKNRFPTIYNECLSHDINISRDRIPVCPVQHYMMGGIETDLDGRTSINGLYACGEAANTGVHGANRLASNSMLECLVFGRRAAQFINAAQGAESHVWVDEDSDKVVSGVTSARETALRAAAPDVGDIPSRPRSRLDHARLRQTVRLLMSEHCHVVRNTAGLQTAKAQVGEILAQLKAVYDDSNDYVETLNIATVADAILKAALSRPESIGSHYLEN